MADYRQIHTKIWSDEWFLDQEPDGKLLFIYLFSNSRSCLAGIYDIPLKVISFETGLAPDRILELLAAFGEAGRVVYQDGYVWIPKMIAYNAHNLANPKIGAHINRTIAALPDIPLRQQWIQYARSQIGYLYPIDTPVHEHEHEQNTSDQEQIIDGAAAPLPDGSPPTPAFQTWLTAIQSSSNRAAIAVDMHTALYPGRDVPDFGRIGQAAKRVGGWALLARYLWIECTRPPVGCVLDYIEAKHKAGGYRSNKSGADDSRVHPRDRQLGPVIHR